MFTLLNEKPPKGHVWSREAFASIHGMSKAAQRKAKRHIDKPKLDDARKLRGIYFLDPDDGELKETFKKRKEKVGDFDGGSCAL